jgi:hypothetical protein
MSLSQKKNARKLKGSLGKLPAPAEAICLPALDRQATRQKRGAPDCGQHGEAAEVVL